MDRTRSDRFRQGYKILPFSDAEYEARVTGLRKDNGRSKHRCLHFNLHAQYRLLFWLSVLRLRPPFRVTCH